MKTLFYKPFMVYNPRVSLILDEMEEAIQNGDEVIFLGCSGELIDGCIYNPFKTKVVCSSCKYFKKNDLSLLSKKPKEYSISDFLPSKKAEYKWEYSTETIKDIFYKDSDIGYACLSAYIEISRNQKPKITPRFKKMFDKLLDTAAMLTDAIENSLDELKPDKVFLFNARIHTRRPVLKAAKKRNINCDVMEHTYFRGNKNIKKTRFENTSAHDIEYITEQINKLWNATDKKTRVDIGKSFYEAKLKGKNVDDISYTKRQKSDLLPVKWESTKQNIVIFNSSDDEFASLGKKWDYTFGKNIFTTIKNLLLEFEEDKNFHFYLRLHPNLKNVNYYYHKVLYKLEVHKNLTIIAPESKISSYSLLENSSKIISFGSTIGMEAVYRKKPSILLRISFTKLLGGFYVPNDFEDLVRLVKNETLPAKDTLPALKYGFFRKTQGESFKHFNPNTTKEFQIQIKDKLLFEYKSDYRDELYKLRFPKISNFIRYKLYSIPKNIRKKISNNIMTTENEQAY